MAITNLHYMQIGSFPTDQNNTTTPAAISSTTLNASGDKWAAIFMVPKTGTLHSFEWRTAAVSNNPDNGMRMSFQDVSATTGLPDGAQDQFFDHTSGGTFVANTWQTPSGPLTHDGTGGGNKRSVTAGQMLAAVIEFTSFTASDSISISTMIMGFDVNVNNNLFYTGDASSGTYAKLRDIPVLALKYDDSTYGVFNWYCVPVLTVNNVSFASNSTPDEQALRFQLPFSASISGVELKLDYDEAVDIVLYDNSSTPLQTVSLDKDIRYVNSSNNVVVRFPSTTLSANTTYRLSIKPTTTTSVIAYTHTVNATGLLGAYPGGAQFYASTRVDGGAWSDSNVTRPLINLILDGIDTSGASGGGSFTFLG